MAGTGEQRLKDKHARKKAKAQERAEAILAGIDGKQPDKRPQLTPEEKNALAMKYLEDTPYKLGKAELAWYMAIMRLVLDGDEPNPEKNVISACEIAKLVILREKCEATLEEDGLFLTSDKGLVYAHPASKMILNIQGAINRGINSMGLKSLPRATLKAQEVKKEEEPVNDFAQFQLPIAKGE